MKMLGFAGTQQEPQQKEIMNWKKFFFAFIAAFVFIFVFGFLWYGNLMQGVHQEVPALWRPEADFGSHFHWLILGHVVMAFFLTLLYARFIPAGGAGAGAMLGILIALVFIGNDLITFAVQPLTTKILCGWVAGGLIMFAIAGAIIGAIYKPASAQTVP
jgi:magnesium-transporting ATPase (P-type)